MAYLTVSQFRGLTIAPGTYVDSVELTEPAWLGAQLDYWSAWIDSRLRKRYDAPFAEPYPIAVTGWLARIVTAKLYHKHGIEATDGQITDVMRDAETAMAEITEAAGGEDNRFDLPLRANTTATGIGKGGPLGYAEASPYTWSVLQREAAEGEA